MKLSPLTGTEIELDNKMKMIRPNLNVAPQEEWIPVEQWLEQNIAWFEKSALDLPDMIPDFVYESILKKFKKADKAVFESMFETQEVMYQGNISKIHTRVDAINANLKVSHF